MASTKHKAVSILNRRASFEYKLLQNYTAGIILSGTEVKAIREGRANISDSFCYFFRDELYIKGMHISEYKQGTYNNHEPKRVRKLLLNKVELKRLQAKAKEKGFSIVPVQLHESDTGFIKLEIAFAQGKKYFDKRNSIKDRDGKRELDRMKKKMG
jgi:SsrA-binding protein